MATKILPQTKTFAFGSNVKVEDRDKEINEWKKQTTLKGDHVSPVAPAFQEDIDGGATYVYTYATSLEVPDEKPKKK